MLDADLAELYRVPTKSLNLAVKRNADRFPGDFAFQLTGEEVAHLRFQFETSKGGRGGIFDVHQLERTKAEGGYGPDIQIPDEAFERIFDYFKDWTWHLDERPLRADNEINPDVLGYIFESYVNQKQMGAYYTREDITDYVGKNTMIAQFAAELWMGREESESNARKHGISFDEGSTVFADTFSLTVPHPAHSGEEERFVTLGSSHRGKLLVVVYTERGDNIHIISTRAANRRARKTYEEKD